MKHLTTIILLLSAVTSFSQISERKGISASWKKGIEIYKALDEMDTVKIKTLFEGADQLDYILDLVQANKINIDSTTPNLYYNPDNEEFVVAVWSGKKIKTDSEWGLYDYNLVVEARLKYGRITDSYYIDKINILTEQSDLKTWWRSLMDSYNMEKFKRDEWAKKEGLIPPPPPPPETTDWF